MLPSEVCELTRSEPVGAAASVCASSWNGTVSLWNLRMIGEHRKGYRISEWAGPSRSGDARAGNSEGASPGREMKLGTEMRTKALDYYCERLRCRMNKYSCIGRQLLAVKPERYRIAANAVLESRGFYPECYACTRGRCLAESCGIHVVSMRRQLAKLRLGVEQSPWVEYRLCRSSR